MEYTDTLYMYKCVKGMGNNVTFIDKHRKVKFWMQERQMQTPMQSHQAARLG